MAATDESLHKSLAEKHAAVEAQGNAVRALKAAKAAKTEIDAAMKALNALKLEQSSIECSLTMVVLLSISLCHPLFATSVQSSPMRRQHVATSTIPEYDGEPSDGSGELKTEE